MFMLITAMLGLAVAGCGMLDSLQELKQVETKLKDNGFANVSVKSSSKTKDKNTTYTVTATVDRPRNPPFDQKLGTQVADIVIMNYPKVKDLDAVVVELKGSGAGTTQSRPPDEWRDLVRDFREPPGIKSGVLSKDVRGDQFEPINPTTDFPVDQAVYHAVVTVRNVPQDTPVKAVWTAIDTRGAAQPNQKVAETEVKATGTQKLHFTLQPNGGKLPAGSYKVDVTGSEGVQRTLPFTVGGG
jgi:hypothetical protein